MNKSIDYFERIRIDIWLQDIEKRFNKANEYQNGTTLNKRAVNELWLDLEDLKEDIQYLQSYIDSIY